MSCYHVTLDKDCVHIMDTAGLWHFLWPVVEKRRGVTDWIGWNNHTTGIQTWLPLQWRELQTFYQTLVFPSASWEKARMETSLCKMHYHNEKALPSKEKSACNRKHKSKVSITDGNSIDNAHPNKCQSNQILSKPKEWNQKVLKFNNPWMPVEHACMLGHHMQRH